MLRNNKNTFLAASVFICGHVLSQNIKTDIAAINKTYQSADKMSLTFELNMFENYQTQNVYYTQNGIIQKSGRSVFQKFDETECVNTPNYSVIIDKEEKEVVYAPKKITFNEDDPAIAVDLDSVLRFCKSYNFKKNSEEIYSYDFIMMDSYPDYNKISFYFSPKTFLIQKLIFYCEEDDISTHNDDEKLAKARIEINYKNINTKPVFNSTDFSYEKYLVKSGSKFELKQTLKEYHLTVLSF